MDKSELNWKIEMDSSLKPHFGCDMISEITKDLVKQLAEEVDKKIIKEITEGYTNILTTASTTFSDINPILEFFKDYHKILEQI